MTKNYHISGPTTEAAVDSLIDEVQLVEGIHTVDVNVDEETMMISGEDFSAEDVNQAAANAGFKLSA